MFRDRASTSRLALSILDDGDDLHITESFCASEENSSTIGNSSVMPQPLPPSPSSTNAGDDCSLSPKEPAFDPEQIKLSRLAILRSIPSLTRSLRVPRKLWSRRLSSLVASQRLVGTNDEYQEMDEDEVPTEADTSWEDASVQSIRSARVDVATGRSFLVRQKAQVVGRPSAAYTDWDIGTVSSEGSKSARSGRSRRSLTWDNSSKGSISDISQLTGDSFRSKRSNFSMSRAMYISTVHSLLGEAPSEASPSGLDEIDVTNSAFFADFGFDDAFGLHRTELETVREESAFVQESKTSPNIDVEEAKTGIKGASSDAPDNREFSEAWELFSAMSSNVWSDFEGSNRQRFFSESDIVFECRREWSKGHVTPESSSGLRDSEKKSEQNEFNRSRTYSDSFLKLSSSSWDEEVFQPKDDAAFGDGGQTIEHSHVNRSRTYSDSFIKLSTSWDDEVLQPQDDAGFDDSSKNIEKCQLSRLRSHSDPFLQPASCTWDDSLESPKEELAAARNRSMSDSYRNMLGDEESSGTRPHLSSDSETSSSSGAPLLGPLPKSRTDRLRLYRGRAMTNAAGDEFSDGGNTGFNEHFQRRGRSHSESDVTMFSDGFPQTASTPAWRPISPKHTPPRKRTGSCQSCGQPLPADGIASSNGDLSPNSENQNQPEERQPPQFGSRLSSPDAASAARMIATNLLPSTAVASQPTKNPSTLHDYYWKNEGPEMDPNSGSPTGDEVLWSFSSDSLFDDIM